MCQRFGLSQARDPRRLPFCHYTKLLGENGPQIAATAPSGANILPRELRVGALGARETAARDRGHPGTSRAGGPRAERGRFVWRSPRRQASPHRQQRRPPATGARGGDGAGAKGTMGRSGAGGHGRASRGAAKRAAAPGQRAAHLPLAPHPGCQPQSAAQARPPSRASRPLHAPRRAPRPRPRAAAPSPRAPRTHTHPLPRAAAPEESGGGTDAPERAERGEGAPSLGGGGERRAERATPPTSGGTSGGGGARPGEEQRRWRAPPPTAPSGGPSWHGREPGNPTRCEATPGGAGKLGDAPAGRKDTCRREEPLWGGRRENRGAGAQGRRGTRCF